MADKTEFFKQYKLDWHVSENDDGEYITVEISGNVPIRIVTENRVSYFPPHIHSFGELIYVRNEPETHFVNGNQYDLNRGSMLLMRVGDIHEQYGAVGDNIYCVQFSVEELSRALQLPTNYMRVFDAFGGKTFSHADSPYLPHQIAFADEEISEIDALLALAHSEFDSTRPCQTHALAACANLLFIRIIRNIERVVDSSPPQIIGALLDYLDAHFRESVSLKELAEEFHYNPYYLGRMFKKYIGKSVSEHVNRLRCIEISKRLIRTDDTVEDISRDAGYREKKQFYQAFNKYFHCTPHQFRMKVKAGER